MESIYKAISLGFPFPSPTIICQVFCSMHPPSLSSSSSTLSSSTSTSSVKGHALPRHSISRIPSTSTFLSVKLLSHKLGGFYKLFSNAASAPVLNTDASHLRRSLGRSKSCDRTLTMSDLTRRCTTRYQNKDDEGATDDKNSIPGPDLMSLRAMELEALINDYPDYTLHLTLTPRLCLDNPHK
jgi:hypothetical protein